MSETPAVTLGWGRIAGKQTLLSSTFIDFIVASAIYLVLLCVYSIQMRAIVCRLGNGCELRAAGGMRTGP